MIIKLRDGRYFDARAYGVETWGTCSQKNMIYSSNKWYEVYDVCLDFNNDAWQKEEILLDVVEEFEDVPSGVKLENEKDHEIFEGFRKNIIDIVDKW